MKKILKQQFEALLVILLFPQLFVLLYFFFPTIRGPGSFGLLKQLLLLGLAISQLFAPIFYLLYWAVTTLNKEQRRAGTSFLLSAFAGYLCLIVWNKMIFESFNTTLGLIPLFICSGGVGLYHYFKDPGHIAPRKNELFLSPDA